MGSTDLKSQRNPFRLVFHEILSEASHLGASKVRGIGWSVEVQDYV